jgi:hypothetical protein
MSYVMRTLLSRIAVSPSSHWFVGRALCPHKHHERLGYDAVMSQPRGDLRHQGRPRERTDLDLQVDRRRHDVDTQPTIYAAGESETGQAGFSKAPTAATPGPLRRPQPPTRTRRHAASRSDSPVFGNRPEFRL